MSKDKLAKYTRYAALIKSKMDTKVPPIKHANRAAEYKAYLLREYNMVNKVIDSLKLIGDNKDKK